MNIGILIGRFPPDLIGGAELQSKQVAEQFAQRGHNVTVFTRRYHNRPYLEKVDGYTIRRRNELPIPVLRMIWDTFPALWHIARLRPRPQVLLAYQTFNSGFIGVIAQAIFRIPTIVSIRGNVEYRLKSTISRRFLGPFIYQRARLIIVQTPSIREDVQKQFQAAGKAALSNIVQPKMRVIPNGIHLKNKARSNGKKIIYVGRLFKKKGVADLLSAMKQISGAEALIVGDGPDRKRLENLASGVAVKFVGQVDPSLVSCYLQQARLLVLPSYSGDGLPNVILEAMACGVPVVATRVAGIPDLVQHGETGFLFEPGDIQSLVSFIDTLLQNDDLWQRFGERCLDVVRYYSWDAVIPHMENLLLDVVK